MLAPPRRAAPPSELKSETKSETTGDAKNDVPRDVTPPVAIEHIPAAQDNSPAPVAVVETAPAAAPSSPPTEASVVTAAPLFRQRADIPKDAAKGVPAGIPAVIPIVRAPDDPGIDEDAVGDEFAEPVNPAQGQAGGWRGFLARWGG